MLAIVLTPDASRILYTYAASANIPRSAAFNTTNPHKDGWCEHAVCHNSPVCTPCNKRYLFILAPGRTGSTTLLSMFNKLPGVRLSGENYNELHLASDLVQNIVSRDHFQYDVPQPKGSFMHNAIPTGALSCVSQHLVDTLNPPPMWLLQEAINDQIIQRHEANMISGMKTVRLHEPFPGSKTFTPTEAVNFLNENFPCSRFIIGERSDHEGHAASTHRLFNVDGLPKSYFLDESMKNRAFYQEVQELFGPDKAKTVDLDKWMNDVEILNDVVNWLGFTSCRFNAILHENHHGKYGEPKLNWLHATVILLRSRAFLAAHETDYETDTTSRIHMGENCKAPV